MGNRCGASPLPAAQALLATGGLQGGQAVQLLDPRLKLLGAQRYRQAGEQPVQDPALAVKLLELPGIGYLAEFLDQVDPLVLVQRRERLLQALAAAGT